MRSFRYHHDELAWLTDQLNFALALGGYASERRKLEPVVAFVDVIQTEVRRYSRRRPLALVDCGAGTCLLSLVAALLFGKVDVRPVETHCVDRTATPIAKNRDVADRLGLDDIHFHSCDICDPALPRSVDAVNGGDADTCSA